MAPWALGKRRCSGLFADAVRGGRIILSLPNFITLARILIVPVVVWAITSDQMLVAFILFVVAGVSDAVDGFLAKRFGMASELGAFLDPLADKALLVSIYVSLGVIDALPRWLVIMVVSRDILIVGAVIVSWLVGKPIAVKPHFVSKLNTGAQIVLAALVLGLLGLNVNAPWLLPPAILAVTALTLLSAGLYVAEWVRHMGLVDSGR